MTPNHSARPPATDLLIRVDHRAETGLQQQVYFGVRRAILDGILAAGTRLPSSRALADDLNVSRTTTLLAYDQLSAEGYVSARHGSGTFVARDLPDDVAERLTLDRTTRTRHPQPSRRGIALADTPWAATRIAGPPRPFRLGAPALDLFPLALWTRLISRRLRSMTMGQ